MFDTGNTGFMLVATSLVMLMTPGLAFFYGGLVGRKNVLAIMLQSFVSMGWTSVLWFAFGYSMCFSGTMAGGTDIAGIIGNFDMVFFKGIDVMTPLAGNNIPLFVFIAYQMMFAIITPALITGAFTNRIRFVPYLMFLTVWLIFVYFPMVHMIWGGGLLQSWGVLDFAGGIVVHAIAGMAALASVFYVGRRRVAERGPHSIPLVALGTGLLWFGWYGFNAGSELRVDQITSLAFLNTDTAASFAAITWLIMAWIFEKKPKLLGLLTGSIAGLATITPAAGYVTVQTAAMIGIIAGMVCYGAISLKNKLGWDDSLDVWGVHGVGGTIGVLLLGLFATTTVNANGANGWFYGNPGFFVKQTVAVAGASIYAFLFSYLALIVINKISPVRTTEAEEMNGLDASLHGEEAYIHD
ncbi:MAG: ammonium transporter [Candidatus Edwardsbacteria bacterium RIFOXYD12_FULL_50_11]|jgi:Amt family ammonium transporter|uniref:Ammonium transporter n=1 Tax=Candidatus Edwardsbacteria bacterium GWF2_54_11 TaxID=1817851 RepID=A0A1F5RIZ7_9BACT|nr:MAG: ammonium transporter [Candidatus Edwardsbacteria bacterium RifOxyC12_full_54_24]OGF08730.1 MAG: ammonium transporter [Candidatus Edwardsbacteria bacterium RifOxyA12_full_54_48]OGF12323.1 MAG: ammonium transporter [Candidatus Edwardsbacteria bacterium GWE2_54_12]OGF14332.1 MAG: ammonium transporter [Candidatus Edwardsbacteria bacterium GWF2_54_11]OGF15771.1 MAG: ammonium transporter [Candidatus Edwardsbacteria bacterium RIFOXYD12_FULL_50_11]OGJ18187.1 MAG: ammonium transporter [Candidat